MLLAVPCCVLCCTYSFVLRTCQVSVDEVSYLVQQYRGTPHQLCIIYIVDSRKKHFQLSYNSVARSAAPCGAVPCPAVRCGSVPCCAVLSFEHTAVPGTGMYMRARFSAFFVNCHPRQLHPHCRSERDFANMHAHNTAQGNQVCPRSSWHYQIASCTK